MAKTTTYDMVGKKEDVSDILYDVSPTECPYTSKAKKGKASNTLVQWYESSLDAAADNALVEGADATPGTLTQVVNRTNYTQILGKSYQIAGSADAVEAYGRDKESARAVIKTGKELKRDLEKALLSGQEKAAGDSTTARKTASIQAQIDTSLISNPGTAATISKDAVLDVMEDVFNAGGAPTVMLVRPSDAAAVSEFASASRVINDKSTTLTGVVEVWRTPYGTLNVEIDRFLKQGDCLIYDPSYIELMWLRPWFTEQLAKTGDSTKFQMLGEVAHANHSQFGHCLLRNLTN